MSATCYQSLNKKSSGWSVIELMMAISIGLLVMSVMLTIYVSSQQSLALQLDLSNIQNNSQKTYHIFKRVLERTGRLSCFSISHDSELIYSSHSLTLQNMVSGSKNELIVRYVDYPGSSLLAPIENQLLLSVDLNQTFKPQDILIISDCHHAEMFQVKTVFYDLHKQTLKTVKPLQYHYENHAEVGRFVIDHFVIKATQRFNKDGSRIYGLFVTNNHRTRELVEGVEAMNIQLVREEGKMIGVGISLCLKSGQITKDFEYYFSL